MEIAGTALLSRFPPPVDRHRSSLCSVAITISPQYESSRLATSRRRHCSPPRRSLIIFPAMFFRARISVRVANQPSHCALYDVANRRVHRIVAATTAATATWFRSVLQQSRTSAAKIRSPRYFSPHDRHARPAGFQRESHMSEKCSPREIAAKGCT